MCEQAEVVSNGVVEETSIAAVRSLNNLNNSYRESDGLKEDGRQKDLEARKGLSVLGERMQQRDCPLHCHGTLFEVTTMKRTMA
jgi:uncharacterized protein (UPF0147 family)